MKLEEETLSVKKIYDGKILNLRVDDVKLPDGNTAIREIVEHSGGACIYCEKDGKVLMVKQFRYPYKKVIYEIPAGKINKGETPEQTALRELTEEGGVKAEKVELLFEVYPSPGYTEEIIYVYKAINVTRADMHLDEDEFLTSEWIEKDKLKEMISSGEIKDGKTLIALLNELK